MKNRVIITATIKKRDEALVVEILKRLKARHICSVENKEIDDAKMLKGDYFLMIDKAREGKKIKMSRKEMKDFILNGGKSNPDVNNDK